MTEAQLRATVVSIATQWLGRKESDGSHKTIIDTYNAHTPRARGYKVTYTDAWCATFASAVFIKAGLTDIAPTECSCSRLIQLYKDKGRWKESDSYIPRAGDLIMYDWNDNGAGDNTGAPEHVGIVAVVSGNTIKVIEGNYSNSVKYRSITVNGRYIRGYCLPDYASKASKVDTTTSTARAKTDPARSFERAYAKTYTVTASGLNLRTKAATTYQGKPVPVIRVLQNGEKVTCYGYFTKNGETIWLYVKDKNGVVGFCSKKYLK